MAQIDPARRSRSNADGNARGGSSERKQPERSASCKAMFAELSNYLDEQLDDSLCKDLEEHFQTCPPCRAFLASLEATIGQIRGIPNARLDRASAAKIRRQLLATYPFRRANNFPP
jgi:hypothetical protein